MSAYAFDNAWRQARRRLALLEECLDPATFRRIKPLGIADGWHCLEVGAGAGSVARCLCSQVGARGRVVATDIDTRFLEGVETDNLEIRRHDLTSECLAQSSFDLIHSRLVLMHIPSREELIPRLVSALKPGGWLLLEEHDIYPVLATACGSYREVWNASTKGMVEGGAAVDWGRQLPLLLAKQGLSDVGAEGDIRMFPGVSPMAEFWRLSFEQVRERIETRLVEKEALDDTLKMLCDATHWFTGPAVIAAWGRR
jgi:SAM-dependent methyltransferase